MLKASLKLLLIVLWGLIWFLPVWLAGTFHKIAWRDWMRQFAARGFLHIIGIRLRVRGEMSSTRPLLLVSNHLSYCDVLILASQATLCFTPKSEIGKWPVISTICRMTGCIFIDRRPEKIKEMRQALHTVLERGEVVSLFPEATTGNGMHVLPFKSGFFSLAEEGFNGRTLTIQPVAISYTHICNLPIDRTQWPYIAWYGDMDLVPHLWTFLQLGPVDAELAFLSPVTLNPTDDRKTLAMQCHRMIALHIEEVKAQSNV